MWLPPSQHGTVPLLPWHEPLLPIQWGVWPVVFFAVPRSLPPPRVVWTFVRQHRQIDQEPQHFCWFSRARTQRALDEFQMSTPASSKSLRSSERLKSAGCPGRLAGFSIQNGKPNNHIMFDASAARNAKSVPMRTSSFS